MKQKDHSNTFFLSCFIMALAIALSAFGAHGLEKITSSTKRLATFKTGGLYHLIHGLALFGLSILQRFSPQISLKKEYRLFTVAICLFSGNCYLYALTGVKTFAMIVPLGGSLFIITWLILGHKLRQVL